MQNCLLDYATVFINSCYSRLGKNKLSKVFLVVLLDFHLKKLQGWEEVLSENFLR